MANSAPSVALGAKSDGASTANLMTAARGGGILFFGRLFEYASRFVFGIVVARSLGADGLGLYALGVTTAVTLASLARLGLSEGVVRFLPSALHGQDTTRAWGILQVSLALPFLLGVALAVVLFASSGFVAHNLLHEPTATPILQWISVSIPLTALGRVLMAATRGFKTMRYEVYADAIGSSLTRLGLAVLLLSLGLGLAGVVAAYVIAWAVACGLLILFLNRLFPLRRPVRVARRDVRGLLGFSAPLCLTQLVTQLWSSFALLLLGTLGSVASAGILGAAVRVQTIGAMFLMAADLVAKPIISELHHRKATAQLGRFYQTLTRWSLSFLLPYFATILLFPRPILAIFGQDFVAGAPALIVVALGTLVSAGTGIAKAMLVMMGHSNLTFLNSLAGTIVGVILSVALIPTWGLMGAAVASAVSTALVNLLCLVEVRWHCGLWPYNWEFIKPIIAWVVALLVGYGVSHLVPAERHLVFLGLDVASLWSAYIAMTLLLGLSDEDRVVLSRAIRRLRTMANGRERSAPAPGETTR